MALDDTQKARMLKFLERARQEAELREQAKRRHPSARGRQTA